MKFLCLIFLFAFTLGCTKHALRPSNEVTFKNDRLYFKGEIFTGVLEERFPQTGTTRFTHYRKGKPHGDEDEYFEDGELASHREYANGKKVGVHEGWFPDGKRRFHQEFKKGLLDGETWEWFASGALAVYARFKDNKLLGKKMWRESGQIYMNYVFTANRSAGLPGTALCYQLRNGEADIAAPTKK